MKREFTDVLISGGGLAGLVAAAAFGYAGYKVILVDPTPRGTKYINDKTDLRSTAYLQPAGDFLRKIGLWEILQPHAVPLNSLRIVDCTGDPPTVRAARKFSNDEPGQQPLGWNFLNSVTRQEFLKYLAKQPGIDLRFEVGFKNVLTRRNSALVDLDNGDTVSAKLLIGADGRNSAVRDAVGIGARTIRYGQKALAFTATHSLPHNNISTEIYHHGGPFTIVPLSDVEGRPASAIVWMNAGHRTQQLAAMEHKAFNKEMTDRSAGLIGPMELASERAVWPVITQVANGLIAERTAIIAEAAHVLPPIGAQGLNTSLNDISALLRAAQKFPNTLGSPEMLDLYSGVRLPDIKRRARAIDLFNRVTRSGDRWLQSLRLYGLRSAHDLTPVRKGLMRAGMGPD